MQFWIGSSLPFQLLLVQIVPLRKHFSRFSEIVTQGQSDHVQFFPRFIKDFGSESVLVGGQSVQVPDIRESVQKSRVQKLFKGLRDRNASEKFAAEGLGSALNGPSVHVWKRVFFDSIGTAFAKWLAFGKALETFLEIHIQRLLAEIVKIEKSFLVFPRKLASGVELGEMLVVESLDKEFYQDSKSVFNVLFLALRTVHGVEEFDLPGFRVRLFNSFQNLFLQVVFFMFTYFEKNCPF